MSSTGSVGCPQGETQWDIYLYNQALKAGEVAQSLFYTFIESSWARDMRSVRIVRDNHGELKEVIVVAGKGVETGPGGVSSCHRKGGSWLVDFPRDNVWPPGIDAKSALLADRNSVWAFIFMHVPVRLLFKHLVKDVDNDIKEVTHYLVRESHHLVTHEGPHGTTESVRTDQPYNDEDGRGVYEITLKNGDKIALDLAGAQYNLPHKTVMYWSDYWARHGSKLKQRNRFRSAYENHVKLMHNFNALSVSTLSMELMTRFSLAVDIAEIGELPLERNIHFLLKKKNNLISALRSQVLEAQIGRYDFMLQTWRSVNGDGASDGFPIGARHPFHPVRSTSTYGHRESLLPTFDHAKDFSWETLKIVAQSTETSDHDKKTAEEMLANRCLYKLCGDWRILFLPDRLPPSTIPAEWVSENPFWKAES